MQHKYEKYGFACISVQQLNMLPTYKPFKQIRNDRHSAIIGVDEFRHSDIDDNTWVESKAVTTKVSKYCKLNTFIENEYQEELKQVKPALFNGRNNFNFDKKCNSCLGYCVEYYSKYLVYGKDFLDDYIRTACKESSTSVVNDGIIVRACMRKYKDMMKKAFGDYVAKLIQPISTQQLIQDKYKEFVSAVVSLGTKAAEFVRQNLIIPDFTKDEYLNSPVLSIDHISGLADYIDEHTIIDIKTTSSITVQHIKQVLAYHYLSTKRSDLDINKVIVYDAVKGKSVTIDLTNHNYGYKTYYKN